MKMKPGRPSVDDLNVVPLYPAGSRVQTPDDLTPSEAGLFKHLVHSCAPDHFVSSDVPLLVSYVQSTLIARNAAKAMTKNPRLASTWERSVRMQATLATRLRLSPQARTDPTTLTRRTPKTPPSVYDLMRDDD
jgi:hypothetical protein